MALACSREELRQLLDDVTFTRNLGFRIDGIGEGQCTINVPFQEAFERPGGIVSGQVFMAAADVAMWLAIKTKLGLAGSSVTVERKTNFLCAAGKRDSAAPAFTRRIRVLPSRDREGAVPANINLKSL